MRTAPPTRRYPKHRTAPRVALAVVGGFAIFVVGAVLGWAVRAPRDGRPTATPDPSAQPPREPRVAPTTKPTSHLRGVWTARGSGRAVRLSPVGDRIELRVVDEARWQRAYVEDEVRAVLRATDDPDRYDVEDRYRPWAPAAGYDEAGRAACLVQTTSHRGRRLAATVVDHDTLEVEMALVTMTARVDASDVRIGCDPPTVTGLTRVRFERRRAVPR